MRRLKTKQRGRRLAVAALLIVFVLRTASASAVSYVDGISDQHMYNWEGAVSNLFSNAWVGSPPSHIRLARYVVQWNVMGGGGYANEYSSFNSWYERAGQLGLTREIALADYVGAVEPSSSAYGTELEKLLSAFKGISVIEAWNEPNHHTSKVNFYVSPAAAGHYMNAAYSVCRSYGCASIAGDFLDEPNVAEYEKQYAETLNPKDPGNWGIHPYAAIETHSTQPVETFRTVLPSPSTDRVWFTEVGAYYCKAGESPPRGEPAQASDAGYLVNTLIPRTTNLEHVFYYEYADDGEKTIDCGKGDEDSELYAPPVEGRPNRPRSAASIIWGPYFQYGVPESVATTSLPPA